MLQYIVQGMRHWQVAVIAHTWEAQTKVAPMQYNSIKWDQANVVLLHIRAEMAVKVNPGWDRHVSQRLKGSNIFSWNHGCVSLINENFVGVTNLMVETKIKT